MIIGCDFHPSWQQIAWLDSETGETGERKLVHGSGECQGVLSTAPDFRPCHPHRTIMLLTKPSLLGPPMTCYAENSVWRLIPRKVQCSRIHVLRRYVLQLHRKAKVVSVLALRNTLSSRRIAIPFQLAQRYLDAP